MNISKLNSLEIREKEDSAKDDIEQCSLGRLFVPLIRGQNHKQTSLDSSTDMNTEWLPSPITTHTGLSLSVLIPRETSSFHFSACNSMVSILSPNNH